MKLQIPQELVYAYNNCMLMHCKKMKETIASWQIAFVPLLEVALDKSVY